MNNLLINSRQQGLTLIEMMIALLMGAVLLAGVLQIFNSTKQTYRMQDNMSRMQENGRFAMEFISRDIRMADYWGCASSTTIENKLNSDTTYDPFANAIAGLDDDNGGNNNDADNDENGNDIWDGTDNIILRGVDNLGIFVSNQPTGTNASIQVTQNSGLVADEIVVISNCVAGDMFQITGLNLSGGFDNVIHGTGSTPLGTPGNASSRLEVNQEPPPPVDPLANRYGPESQINRVNIIEYRIDSGIDNRPALFRKINKGAFQELVGGIEDMQILYGEETAIPANQDNTPDYYVTANNVVDMDNVISIRIDLLVASPDANLTRENVPYTYNGNTYDGVGSNPPLPTDRRLRRVFSSTIAVRNRIQ